MTGGLQTERGDNSNIGNDHDQGLQPAQESDHSDSSAFVVEHDIHDDGSGDEVLLAPRTHQTGQEDRLAAADTFEERLGQRDRNAAEDFEKIFAEVESASDESPARLRQIIEKLRPMIEELPFGQVDDHDHLPFLRMSVAQRSLDSNHPLPVQHADRRARIFSLRKGEWWRLFIDRKHRADGALTYDREASPGYYYAMMNAFEEIFGSIRSERFETVSSISAETGSGLRPMARLIRSTFGGDIYSVPENRSQVMSAQRYDEYHRLVSRYVLSRMSSGDRYLYTNIAPGWSGRGIDFFMNVDDLTDLNTEALRELISEGLVTVQAKSNNPRLRELEVFAKGALAEVELSEPNGILIGKAIPSYRETDAPDRVDDLFARYYQHLQIASKRHEVIDAIVRLIRALHVGHFFSDGNGRMNTVIMLNYFLMEQGFPPAILQRSPGIFGGGSTVRELSDAVVEGMAAFQWLAEPRDPNDRWLADDFDADQMTRTNDVMWRILKRSIEEQLRLTGSTLLERYDLDIVDGKDWTCYIRAVLLKLNASTKYRQVVKRLRDDGIDLSKHGGVEVGGVRETRIQQTIYHVTRMRFHVSARSAFDDVPIVKSMDQRGEEVELLHTGAHFTLLNRKQ